MKKREERGGGREERGGGGVKLPSIVKKDGPHQRGSGDDHGAARRAGSIGARDPLVINGKVLVQKEQPIRFSPCSPGHIIEMCKYLGVNPDREFYLLSVVRRAVVAPFPQDWAVGVDRLGSSYYYNKYTLKVINSHPLSELYLDWVAAERERKLQETELRRKDALEDEEIEEDMGTPWMRFTTEDGGEGTIYWFNFQIRKLYTEPQYKHILEMELEERAEAAQKQEKHDPKKQEKLELEMKMKKAAEKFFSSGLRKFWLRWQLHMMELRTAQAKALVKSGMVSGRMEAKSFRQWTQKAAELAFVRKVMAPLGGRRDKQIVRECFQEWKLFIDSVLGEKKQEAELKEYFNKWKASCAKSLHMKKVKEIIRAMIMGNSLSVNFTLWKDQWQTNKDKPLSCGSTHMLTFRNKYQEVAILTAACIKIQREHRRRQKRKTDNRVAVNQRKQIKYRLLRVCETQQTTLEVNERGETEKSQAFTDPNFIGDAAETDGGSLAVHLLEGALQKAKDETEKARLRQVVRIAKSKSVILPEEPGYGTESVRDEIYRIVDILDPIDRVKIRPKMESLRTTRADGVEEEEEESDDEGGEVSPKEGENDSEETKGDAKKLKVGPGKLAELATALDSLVNKIASSTSNPDALQDQRELDAVEKEALVQPMGTHLHQIAEKAKAFIDRALRPEEKSQALHNKFVVDDRITVLDELDSAMELFLNTVDKKQTENQTW